MDFFTTGPQRKHCRQQSQQTARQFALVIGVCFPTRRPNLCPHPDSRFGLSFLWERGQASVLKVQVVVLQPALPGQPLADAQIGVHSTPALGEP